MERAGVPTSAPAPRGPLFQVALHEQVHCRFDREGVANGFLAPSQKHDEWNNCRL